MRVHILILSSIWVGGDLILTELKGVIVCVSPEEPGPCPKAALLVLFFFFLKYLLSSSFKKYIYLAVLVLVAAQGSSIFAVARGIF